MKEAENSSLLEQLLNNARNVGREGDHSLTAEKFLVAAVECLEKDPHWTNDIKEKELASFAAFLMAEKKILSRVKAELIEYVLSNSNKTYLDILYMQKKMAEAKAKANESRRPVLYACDLIDCILEDPSNAISKCLSKNPDVDRVITSEDESKAETMRLRKLLSSIAESTEKPLPESDDPFSKLFLSIAREADPKRKTSEIKDSEEKKETDSPTGSESEVTAKDQVVELVDFVKKTRTALLEKVMGQDNAVAVFTNGYFHGELNALLDDKRSRPRATFLFAGPPGVGKTYLAETAAEVLQLPFMRFDMSEYSDKEATIPLCGSDSVYKDSQPGVLTEFVKRNPKCILLFDEIEKAHINVIHLFLQILDAGRLKDAKLRKEISFADTIIIFTTNAGKQLYEEAENNDLSSLSRKVILKALEKDVDPETRTPYFPAAICSRFASGNVVMFNRMSAHTLTDIARKIISGQIEQLKEQIGIETEIDEKVYTALLLAEGGNVDARMIRGRAQTFVSQELFELFRLVESTETETNITDIEKIHFTVMLPEHDADIRKLFEPPDEQEIFMFAGEDTVDWCRANSRKMSIYGTQDTEEVEQILREHDIKAVLLDLSYQPEESERVFLNAEDIGSKARNLFWKIRETHGNLPIYLLMHSNDMYGEEERLSFLRTGVEGFIEVGENGERFSQNLGSILERLHQQENIISLAKANKLVDFETGQLLSKDGREAEICLFDFELNTAVDAEDSKNVLSSISKPNIHFNEVIGAADAKRELKYFVEYLRDPKKYIGTGVSAPKGVLLYGPPGTGKTMLAKAMACESNVTFIAAEGNQFLKKHVGEGPESVHELFRTARKYAPSVLFVDEIDAIAKQRTGGEQAEAREEILTAFLTEMDGFKSDPTKPVFVLAATNFDVEPGRRTSLDPALMRRFDRRICVDLPNKEERTRYLRLRISKMNIFEVSDQMLENLAIRSTGMSLASLDSVVELSLRMAIRDGELKVHDDVLEEAFETFNSGDQKQWDVSLLERVARHEAGHAFISWYEGDKPSYLTIVARSSHGGYMQHGNQEEKSLYTKKELLSRIRTSLAGRAAEIVYYGEKDGISTGASGDLVSATKIALDMVCYYGMDEKIGLAVAGRDAESSKEVRDAVNHILSEEMENAVHTISQNRRSIDALVTALIDKNKLSGEEIDKILSEERTLHD